MKPIDDLTVNYANSLNLINNLLKCQVFTCKHNLNNICFAREVDFKFENDVSGLARLVCNRHSLLLVSWRICLEASTKIQFKFRESSNIITGSVLRFKIKKHTYIHIQIHVIIPTKSQSRKGDRYLVSFSVALLY